jgi:hypothetical protein
MPGDTHVLPIDDLKPHYDSRACECIPKVEEYGFGAVVIHNSYDGREITEQACDYADRAVN